MSKGFLQEFREFAVKGNVIDLAVGVVIGTAFGKITSSLVSDVLMPVLGMLTGTVSFEGLHLTLREAQGEVAAVTLNYGILLQTLFNFLMIAFAMFLVIKVINRLKREEPVVDAPAAPSEEVLLLREIRDALRK